MPTLRETFSNIAEAIRTKTGKSDTMTPAQMPTEIAGISRGGGGYIKVNTIFSTVTEVLE